MKKKLTFWMLIIFVIIAIISAPFIIIAMHLSPNNIKNSQVNELLAQLNNIEHVRQARAEAGGSIGPNIRIEINVTENFSKKHSLKVLALVRACFDINTVYEVMLELNQDPQFLPDTDIYIKDERGQIIFSFNGSYYKSYSRTEPPDYAQYKWSDDTETNK